MDCEELLKDFKKSISIQYVECIETGVMHSYLDDDQYDQNHTLRCNEYYKPNIYYSDISKNYYCKKDTDLYKLVKKHNLKVMTTHNSIVKKYDYPDYSIKLNVTYKITK